ncbi:hypothetical protein IFM89_029974 [Coptis chinensis]|uniref:Uncharacterized protein n=1 Tax=Coptis chinensis TaxID=261450 RepID=A0A835IIW4_9MAGN|nr:hypothetical protein IFM89_029974 [Coptis chinensis]
MSPLPSLPSISSLSKLTMPPLPSTNLPTLPSIPTIPTMPTIPKVALPPLSMNMSLKTTMSDEISKLGTKAEQTSSNPRFHLDKDGEKEGCKHINNKTSKGQKIG